ncbi:Major Facilitator Superfamily protein [Paenisporosarcina quisquiliarum]|uniref:MFS transporter n=1 Tax=Psychrobacillus psychrodurans TaxID=126157 RepID=UPI0008D5609E|nr:Major Facilitator Superfamily protein [Paenisporosarcina quisquiliarum]
MNSLNLKFPIIYLFTVGIANIGGWIYLLAINLMVLEETGSALAVSALYIIKPITQLLVGPWAGSVIDRVSTKHMMVTLDVIRAMLILFIPFSDSILIIYILVFFIQMAGAIFEPASFTYMTLLLPENIRNRFNAILSFVHSGAFVTGPLIAGVLFMIGSLKEALFVNVIIFLVCAAITLLLPKQMSTVTIENSKITWMNIRDDWHLVVHFSKKAIPFFVIYMMFQTVMLLTAALDSMEVTFAKKVLHLSDTAYGSLVTIAGIGFLMGAVFTNILVRFAPAKLLMGLGTLLVSVGYVIYSFSSTYLLASIGFFVLSFFLSISNTGYMTYIQSNIPTEMMGRISSLYEMLSSSIQIVVILFLGLATHWFSVKEVVISGSILMFCVAFYLTLLSANQMKKKLVK